MASTTAHQTYPHLSAASDALGEQWFVPITPETDVLCVYCESNPVEPGLPFCDNGFCKTEAIREAQS